MWRENYFVRKSVLAKSDIAGCLFLFHRLLFFSYLPVFTGIVMPRHKWKRVTKLARYLLETSTLGRAGNEGAARKNEENIPLR